MNGFQSTDIGNNNIMTPTKIIDGSVGSKSTATLSTVANAIGAGFDPTAGGKFAPGDDVSLVGKNRINFPFMGG